MHRHALVLLLFSFAIAFVLSISFPMQYLVDKAGHSENLASLSRVVDVTAKESKLFSFPSRVTVPAVDSFDYSVRPVARSVFWFSV